MRGELWVSRREAADNRGARSVQERGLDCRLGAGHAAGSQERTRNMWSILVTLEVSKLSGWLNTDALCQVYQKEGMR